MLQDVAGHAGSGARGFTLIELLVTMTVLIVSLAVAIPLMTKQVEKQHLISAAESLSRDLYRARAEALRRNQDVAVSFDVGTGTTPAPWCYGVNVGGACDCTSSGSCQLESEEVRSGGNQANATHPDVYLDSISFSSDDAIFSPARGLSNGGTVVFSTRDGDDAAEMRLAVVVSTLGRIRLCSPSGSYEKIGRYTAC
jgi:prepilin-type N-terminal cleavage/methylation domain-containing protein